MLQAVKDKIIVKPILKEKQTSSGIIITTNTEPEYLNKGELVDFGNECFSLYKLRDKIDVDKTIVHYYPGSGIRLEFNDNLYIVLAYSEILAMEND